MNKITIIAHGRKLKKCEQIEKIKEKLNPNFSLDYFETQNTLDGINQTQTAIKKGAEIIIAGGGDGTINEVVNGIMQNTTEENRPYFGVLPCGTGNDFSRTLAPRYITDALNDIKIKKIDVGEMTYHNEKGNEQIRYFANIGDIGLSANVVEIVNGSKRRFGSAMTFFASTIRAFISFKHNKLHLKTNEFEEDGKYTAVIFANANFYGGGMGIAPFAVVDDGLLDLTLIRDIKMYEFIKHFSTLRKKEKIVHPKVFYHKTQTIEITSNTDKEYPIQADGEFIGFTPVKVRLLPKALSILI